MQNLATKIRRLADQHRDLAGTFTRHGEIDMAIHHRQFSSELFQLIVEHKEATDPEWIECRHCGRVNSYSRNYCDCGHRIELI